MPLKETEKRQREVGKRTKIGRKVEITKAIMQLRQSEMRTSKSVGGISCSGCTISFRFLAEYSNL